MLFNKITAGVLVGLIMSVSALAQNKDSNDTIFKEPTGDAVITQVILGITDFSVAGYLWRSSRGQFTPEGKALELAEENLKKAERIFTSEEEKREYIRTYKDHTRRVVTEDDIENMESNLPVLSPASKAEAVAKAEQELASARGTAVQAAAKSGALGTAIKGVKVVGATVFFVDGMSRIYIWNALNANPTLSPVGTYLKHEVSNAVSTTSPSSAH